MTAKMNFSPTVNYQQAGIIVYQDDDNYVKLTRAFSGSNVASAAKEINGVYTQSLPAVNATDLYFKISKVGMTYTLWYRAITFGGVRQRSIRD